MDEEKILGVEKRLLEEFLVLLRDKYEIVDAANYFLESRTGISGSKSLSFVSFRSGTKDRARTERPDRCSWRTPTEEL